MGCNHQPWAVEGLTSYIRKRELIVRVGVFLFLPLCKGETRLESIKPESVLDKNQEVNSKIESFEKS